MKSRWGKKEHQLGLSLNLKSPYHGSNPEEFSFDFTSIIKYDWRISIGSNPITETEFENLAALKIPIVQFRGEWVEMDPKEIDHIIRFMKEHTLKNPKTGIKYHHRHDSRLNSNIKSNILSFPDVIHLTTGSTRINNIGRIVSVQTDSHLKNLLHSFLHSSNLNQITIPSTFHGNLRPYQIEGVSWMKKLRNCELGLCLADDMGLGKTIQIIAMLVHDLQDRKMSQVSSLFTKMKNNSNSDLKPSLHRRSLRTNHSLRVFQSYNCSLIICPISLLGNWSREIARFAPSLRVYTSYGSTNLTMKNLSEIIANYDVILTSYSRIIQTPRIFTQINWQNLIVDEAQNIKNPNAKQTKTIKTILARYRIALTGTPIENHLTELWSIFDFLNPGYLGCLQDFRHNFAYPIERCNDFDQLIILKKLISPFILRRLKTDVNIIRDLPPKDINHRTSDSL